MQDVVAGRLDTAMIAEHSVMSRELRWSPFIREPLFLIAPLGTPLADLRTMLVSHPFVRFRSAVPLARLIEAELGRLNLPLVDIAEMDAISSITACVAHGLGVSVVPRVALLDTRADVTAIPFGEPVIHREIGLIQVQNSPRACLIVELRDKLAELSGEYGVARQDPARF